MPLFVEQIIYCSGCGLPYKCDFNMGWVSRSANARVCSRECKDKVELAYARCVLGTPDPADLATQMAADPEFVRRTEAGWRDIDAGRCASLDEVKRRLRDEPGPRRP